MTIPEITTMIERFKQAITEEQQGTHTNKAANIIIYEDRHKELVIELAEMKSLDLADRIPVAVAAPVAVPQD